MIESRIIGSRPSRLLAEAANFLHSLDVDGDRAVFFPSSRGLLGEAAFVDGRSDIATGAPEMARLSELLRSSRPEPAPDRFIFHVSFCGSTLLSRLLDVPGHSLVLKEPNCLVDLATWKSLTVRAGKSIDRLDPALHLARFALRRPFALGEAVTVKPSSWVNNLIPELTADPAGILPLFVTIGRAGFLRAVLRGGSERLGFAARLAWHLAPGFPNGDRLLRDAVEAAAEPLGQAANLAVLAHHLEIELFDEALKRGNWGKGQRIDLEEMLADPVECARKAARALRLPLDPDQLARNVERFAGRHSKDPARAYSAESRREDDATVSAHHQATIEAALDWAGRALAPAVPA